MALLLNIDTALSVATVSIADGDHILIQKSNAEQRNHGSFVQPAIQSMLAELKIDARQLDAIAVSAGPGSYTGLRVGLASAKGLCFSWNKPLIMVNTLEVLTRSALLEQSESSVYYCPMIDARRMEVFAAIYKYNNEQMETVLEPGAYLLEDAAFLTPLRQISGSILFFGNGMAKWKEISTEKADKFLELAPSNAQSLNLLAQNAFSLKIFADVAYSEPFYFKSFYTTAKIINEN